MVGGRYLWNKYDNGDNLLFRQQDLDAPDRSPLFQELVKLNDPEVRQLVQALATAARQPLEQAPLLDEVIGAAIPTARLGRSYPVAVGIARTEAPATEAITDPRPGAGCASRAWLPLSWRPCSAPWPWWASSRPLPGLPRTKQCGPLARQWFFNRSHSRNRSPSPSSSSNQSPNRNQRQNPTPTRIPSPRRSRRP